MEKNSKNNSIENRARRTHESTNNMYNINNSKMSENEMDEIANQR